MGRGDGRTGKGKRFKGSHGNTRKKPKKSSVSPSKKVKK